MHQALQGMKVLDVTRLLPGPLCTMYLADYGAEIIKIEDPTLGDYAREMEPMLAGAGALYQLVNRGKKSITLNLQQEEGKEILRRLAREADILVEGFRPGVMHRLGLDYETIRHVNPRLIYCSVTGYGQNGPYAEKAGHDLNYIGFTGLLHEAIHAGGHPTAFLPPVQIADIGAGTLHAVSGILLAIVQRERTGEGAYLDISMTDGVLPFMIPALSYYLAAQETGQATFNPLTGALACYNVYETGDGKWMALGALEAKFWRRFCEVAELNDYMPDYWSPDKQSHIKEEVAAYFKERSAAEIMGVFADEDVCLTPVLSLEEALHDMHLQARGMFAYWDAYPTVTQVKNPLLDEAMLASQTFPPTRGADTEEILRGLGYDAHTIQNLKQRQII
ncbi:CaiB/BaiF CoA-transferase family protein [Aneurinibacillus migulanus]|uniref:CaiB/BaiF CoA transferase family protein n=1 Tax=Aneurinibacillus migulanus TaxID=47500 RepID=UPI002E1FA32E|nr:CaiB/BaiF CoA-transferase family protein [Aneurinibacillus migulanus]